MPARASSARCSATPRDAVQSGRRIATVRPRGRAADRARVHDAETATFAALLVQSDVRRLLLTGLSAAAVLVPAGPRAPTTWSTAAASATASGCPSTAPTATPCARAATSASILGHYYPGTTSAGSRARACACVLRDTRVPKVCGATRARAAGGRSLKLRDTRTYAFSAYGAGKLRVVDTCNGRTRARLTRPGARDRRHLDRCAARRSTACATAATAARCVLARDGARVLAVNDLGLESYLYGVVPPRCRRAGPPRR